VREPQTRRLTFRYVGALIAIAALLVAGQLFVQRALDGQEDNASVVNLAGRQRMLSQRLCMLLLAMAAEPQAATSIRDELRAVADEWEASQRALRARDNSDAVTAGFAEIDHPHRMMLDAARAGGPGATALARANADTFLDGMDRIVATYEAEARTRVVRLRYAELALLALALAVLVLEGAFVFRPAVQALRLYLAQRDRAELEVVRVSDREQQRLARDLHDGLCQQLVGIQLLARTAPLDKLEQLVGEAIAQTRSLARGLHAPADVDGLAASLRQLGAQTEALFGVACRVDVAGDLAETAADTCNHLYRIAREAMVNAAKHAHASSIDLVLAQRDAALVLSVRDDGVGLAAAAGGGLGLHMMRSRAKMLGAVLDVGAGGSGGTVVTCTLPHAS
jgi:signal transduction histidine kinase